MILLVILLIKQRNLMSSVLFLHLSITDHLAMSQTITQALIFPTKLVQEGICIGWVDI